MTKTYKLTIDEDQARCIQNATELLSRVMGGQWNEMMDWLPLKKDIDWSEYHNDMDIIAAILSKHMKDGIDGRSASFGVGCRHLHKYHDIAWDLHQVLRHKMSWEYAVEQGYVESEDSPRNWKEMMTVNYDEPMKWGESKLAKIERVKEND